MVLLRNRTQALAANRARGLEINWRLAVVLITASALVVWLWLLYSISWHAFAGNSDDANAVFAGRSLVHGNPLLRGWELPGDPYWLTDLPVYGVVASVAGLRPSVMHLVPTILAAAVVLVGVALSARGLRPGGHRWAGRATTFVLIGLPVPLMATFFLQGPQHVGTVLTCLIAFAFISFAINSDKVQPRILVFSKTAAFRHGSIPRGKQAIQTLGLENGFLVDTTENADFFTDESLKKYAAIIFLNTTGDVLNNDQQAAFERYIKKGGGYVGVHAATDTEYDWAWYGKLVGAYFENHPKVQQATLIVKDQHHISTRHLPAKWIRTDEWYNFKNLNKDVHVLITIDETSYTGGKNGDYHPMAWYHEYDGGRAFYTEFGHTDESYTEKDFLQHLLGGIQYAIGKK